MSPLDVLQDPSFGAWLRKQVGDDHATPGSEVILALDMAGAWPLNGSVMTALASLGNGPCDWGPEEAAEIFGWAQRFAASMA